jgi:FSR family fosmidomycin resistance protein-like MFS transporter
VRFLLPLVVAAGGGSIADVGTTLFIISIARVGAPMAGGYIADRMNKGTLLCYSVIISTTCLVPAALIIGAPSLILYILGVSALEANIAATAAMAQEMAPHARSVASSLSMGFSWGMAELLVVPLGMVADFTNLTTALLVMAVVPLLALPSALKLKKAQSARQFLDTRT